MKNLILISGIVLSSILFSCGGASQKEVCDCEKLYQNMKDLQYNYRINDQMDEKAAKEKVMQENKAAYDQCAGVRKRAGDRGYFKMSQKCK